MIVQIVNSFMSYEGCIIPEYDALWVPGGSSYKDMLYPIKKDIFRLPDDDGCGSGPVYIETIASHYTRDAVSIMAKEHDMSSWDNEISLSHDPLFVCDTIVLPDYLPSDNLPQNVPWRIGYLIGEFTSPKDFFKDFGIYGHVSGEVCHTVWARHWNLSDHYHEFQVGSCYRFLYKNRYYVATITKYWYNDDYTEYELSESFNYFFNNDRINKYQFEYDIRYWSVKRMAANGTNYQKSVGNLTLTGAPTVMTPYKNEYSYWFNHANGFSANTEYINTNMFSECFNDAFKAFPEVQQNTIANVMEIVSSIKDIISKPHLVIGGIAETVKEAWLAYRYSYSTTRSDIEELAKLSERLLTLGEKVKCFGQRFDNGIAYHCEIVVDSSKFIPEEMRSLCEKFTYYGAELSLYNVWDMVPYSFICDWFLDVGSMLESIDIWLQSSRYQIDEVWYSAVSEYPMGTKIYFRWLGQCPALPTFAPHISKNKTTWLKRAADLISII